MRLVYKLNSYIPLEMRCVNQGSCSKCSIDDIVFFPFLLSQGSGFDQDLMPPLPPEKIIEVRTRTIS